MQLWSRQEKVQSLPGPQAQVPLAHTPSQLGLLPAQVTWQGPAVQSKSQVLPCAHWQSPLAQTPYTLSASVQAGRCRCYRR